MLSEASIERLLDRALEVGDFAEVFCERNHQSLITADTQKVETSSIGTEAGVGLRIFRGVEEIYVYSDGHSEENALKLLEQTAQGMSGGGHRTKKPFNPASYKNAQSIGRLHTDVDYGKKLDVVNRALGAGKGYAPEIGQVFVRYLDMCQDVIIANSDGVFAEDRRVKTRLMIIAYAQDSGGVASGWQGPGAMKGFEFYESLDIENYARDAARMAATMLRAEKCQGARMPVVVANGFGGLIFHEACGHSLEASAVSKGTSEFSGKMGQLVASPLVTLIDDGSIKGAWGSLSVDDEGTPTQKNILIEKGVLKSYMVDRLGALKMGMPVTGSARRQNYRFAPTSRMTNTYIESGASDAQEIIAATERGLYVRQINGGSVNPATGDFNFASSESYLIEKGKIGAPVSGATLIGNGLQALKNVDMAAGDSAIGEGYCFAGSGALFIGAGQPTVRISEMTIGGVR
ncbi:MAG: TldD/PmbA family protein [Treponema sp.]|nr:TldD/PmbA family protein [Treponema sp.]